MNLFIKNFFICLVICILSLNISLFAKDVKIIERIKNEIITNIDIEKEALYLIVLNKEIQNLDKKEIQNFAKNSIITEKIKEIEIKKYYDLNKENKIVNKILNNLYKKLNYENELEFKKYIENRGLSIETFKKKAKIEALWNDLIYNKFKNNIEIDINQIKQNLKKEIKLKKVEKSYNLSEIFFFVESKDDKEKLLKVIKNNIEKDGFKNAALRFSKTDSSKFGGEIGWVKESQLSKLIIKEIAKTNKGEISNPITMPGGVLILKVNNIKKENIKVDFDNELNQRVFFEKNRQLKQYSKIYFSKIKKNLDNL